MMVKANINEGETGKANLVIDSTAELLKDRGILVAKALYRGEQNELPLRVINLSDSPQTLTENSWTANAELVPDQNIINDTTNDESEGIPQFKEIFDRCKNLLTPEQTGALRDLLHKNQQAFSMSKYDIGLTDIVQHKINTNGAPPVKQAPRRLPIAQRKEVEVEIHKMLDNDIIRPSQSPYSSPLVIVRKADSSTRVCCDFRRVNLVNLDSLKDSYPFPRIDDSLDALRGNAWFSTLDLVSDKEFILDTDANGTGSGAVLSQIGDDGKENVVAYYSKSFSKPEKNYCVTRRELLAIINAITHFHHYLYGIHFCVRTDHGALTWITNFKNPEGQLARWRPCSTSCTHCEKQENQKQADEKSNSLKIMEIRAMSADNQDQVESNPIATNWVQGKSRNELMESQMQDDIIKIVRQWKVNLDVKPQWQEISHLSKIHKAYWAQWDRLVVVDGILYRKWINTITNTQSLQYILHHTFRREVLKLLLDDPLAGHMGIKRTSARVRHRFYWVGYQIL
ncbi:unnamed protein product [Mytilus coruscus]|uniref:Reverse transcriptase RNase H-like domain-containing protein n=1 Tax=Mytilus coruscus TaxID=42192 RepID=A0A6J8BP03_MYTCO|nr:unnamed protein product [Mytilus coruscus]